MREGIILIGLMGSGKTEVGAALAERIGAPFVDTDSLVERAAGKTVAAIFSEEGEPAFREREARAVRQAAGVEGAVIACGGGAVLDPRNVEVLRRAGRIVYLAVTPQVAAARVGDGAGRPLLAGRPPADALEQLLHERRSAYEGSSDYVVDGGGTVEETADAVAGVLGL